MAQQIINNLESGAVVRGKLNDNFAELYSAITTGVTTSDSVATRAAMKAITPLAGSRVYLNEGGRSGSFTCFAGAPPVTDLQEGLFVISNTSGFFWAREWNNIAALPEWFGVQANNSAVAAANLTAINAAITLCPVLLFGRADYWVNGRINHQTPYTTLQGVRGDGYNTGTGTRIISTNSAVPVIRHGPDTQPLALDAHMRGIVCRDITFAHLNNYAAPTAGSEATAVPVVDRRWLIEAVFERINAWEPLIGFYSRGLVACRTRACKVLRTTGRAASGQDFCWANFIDGTPIAAGIPGNPSYYEEEFGGEFNPVLANSIDIVGVVLSGDFSDVFLSKFETANATSGMRLLGSGTKAQINTHLNEMVFDQCKKDALDIQGLAAGACIGISGGYYQSTGEGVASPGQKIIVHLRGGNGTINVTGDCRIAGGVNTNIIGVLIQGQQAVNIGAGVSILEVYRPIVMTGTSGAMLLCTTQNDTIGDGTQSAVETNATDGITIAIQARGRNNAFARGVGLVGTSNSRVKVDPTLIDRNLIAGGAANLVVVDPTGTPVPLTAPGYYTSAGAAGTAGAGINVVGITA